MVTRFPDYAPDDERQEPVEASPARLRTIVVAITCTLSVAAVLFVTLVGVVRAHEAPKGWRYPALCCSDRDCKPSTDIRETATGYLLTTTGEMVAYQDKRVKNSPDGEFHICQQAGDFDNGRVLCMFVPPRSY